MRRQTAKERFHGRRRVRSGGHDHKGLGGIGRLNSEPFHPAPVLFHAAVPPVADEEPILIGHQDQPQHRPAFLNQSHVDREFPVSLDEFLRAVQGVHKPEPLPMPPRLIGNFRPFLGKQRDLRRDPPQAFGQDGVRVLVRQGQRRSVFLGGHGERRMIHVQDGCTGRTDQLFQFRHPGMHRIGPFPERFLVARG